MATLAAPVGNTSVDPAAPTTIFVDDREAAGAALAELDAPTVGVDVERADADRYFRRAALVQVGVAGHCVLFDAATLEALPDLDAFLDASRLAVFHAAENDVGPLVDKGVAPQRLADTAIAAALLGRPTGLRALLAEVLGVHLDGDKESFQRADWTARPLSGEMAAYAAGDVVHLPALWAELEAELADTGRTAWYEQELAWTLAQAEVDGRAWTRVKGAARMSPRERAVLRALWERREEIAQAQDIAPNRLLHDNVLRDLATDPPESPAHLVRRSPRRRGLLRRHADALFGAVEAGLAAQPEVRDAGPSWTDADRAALDAMRRARSATAADLGLDPGVLCPSRQLTPAVTGQPHDREELCRLAHLRPWQQELLGDALWAAYERALTGDDAPADEGEPA